jgi:hypothetical protein
MNPEVALMYEVWDNIKSTIPQKERLQVAESMVRIFDEHVDISEVENNLNEFDTIMKTAIVSHFDIGLEEEDEDEDWEY